jgi:ferritin-like metal-binding protein YciE
MSESHFNQETIMTVKTLGDLFHETVKDLYYAEKKLVKSLPKMMKKANAPELKSAIQHHLAETEAHVARLEEVFAEIDKKPVAKKCEALEGLLKEADEVLGDIEDAETCDAAIISSAQTVEHYEIARYRTLIGWARQLGLSNSGKLLEKSLREEMAADDGLTGLAEGSVNQKAAA